MSKLNGANGVNDNDNPSREYEALIVKRVEGGEYEELLSGGWLNRETAEREQAGSPLGFTGRETSQRRFVKLEELTDEELKRAYGQNYWARRSLELEYEALLAESERRIWLQGEAEGWWKPG